MSIFGAAQSSRSLRIEARVLAGQTPAEIAAMENLPIEVVEGYESLLFDVRNKLHAPSYIRNYAIGLDPNTAQPHSWPAFVRMAAHSGGPLVLDAAFRSAMPIPQGVTVDPLTLSFRCLWLLQQSSVETLSPVLWKELEMLAAACLGPGKTVAPVYPAARLADLVAGSPAADWPSEAGDAHRKRQVG
jgi:hypothetical protein